MFHHATATKNWIVWSLAAHTLLLSNLNGNLEHFKRQFEQDVWRADSRSVSAFKYMLHTSLLLKPRS